MHERGSRQVQAHHLHQHLVAVRGAVEGTGARAVIGLHLRLQQFPAAHLSLRVQLADPGLFGVGKTGRHRAARHEYDGQMSELQGADQQARHDLVAYPEAQHAVEHVVRQRDRGGHRDDVARKQRQLHARLTLGDAIAHRRHAAGELRDRARIARSLLDDFGKPPQRLVRRQHVVVRRHDGQIGALLAAQHELVVRRKRGHGMRQVRAGYVCARCAGFARRFHAPQVLRAAGRATLPDPRRGRRNHRMKVHVTPRLRPVRWSIQISVLILQDFGRRAPSVGP